MPITKRDFLKLSGAAGIALSIPAAKADEAPALENMTGAAVQIGVDERKSRVAKAQRLMQRHDIDAVLIEAGSALVYFTGVRWWRFRALHRGDHSTGRRDRVHHTIL